jgi:hypothetical protein
MYWPKLHRLNRTWESYWAYEIKKHFTCRVYEVGTDEQKEQQQPTAKEQKVEPSK